MNKRTLHFRIGALLALVAVSVLLGSCSSSSSNSPTSGNTGTGGNLIPKTGTTYTYDLYQTDSTGAKVPGTDTTIIATVTASGIDYLGKHNVYQVNDGGTTNSFASEQNGDLDFAPDTATLAAALRGVVNTSLTNWFTFFTGSHVKGDLEVYDTTITMSVNIQGVPANVTIEIKGTTGYITQEAVQVGSESLDCSKVHLKLKITYNAIIFSGTITEDNVFWYSPKIGYFAKETTSNSGVSLLHIPASGRVQILTAYQLK